MRSAVVTILLVLSQHTCFEANALPKNDRNAVLYSKGARVDTQNADLVNRALKAWPYNYPELDRTTLTKEVAKLHPKVSHGVMHTRAPSSMIHPVVTGLHPTGISISARSSLPRSLPKTHALEESRRGLLQYAVWAAIASTGGLKGAAEALEYTPVADQIIMQPIFDNDPWAGRMPKYPQNLIAGSALPGPDQKNVFSGDQSAFERFDESDDGVFYSEPRFVYHIDNGAIAALTNYYDTVFRDVPKGGSHLDLCSSWVSFLPVDYVKKSKSIVGVGMNAQELGNNTQLTSSMVYDLNKNPKLPFEDNSFDVVTNVVSIDYLNKPVKVLEEVRRILKPGGIAVFSFSNRLFQTKAVQVWSISTEWQRVLLCAAYFSTNDFSQVQAYSLKTSQKDPMYIVQGKKPELST